MGVTITAHDVDHLGEGVWRFQMPPPQFRIFGECRRAVGARSIVLVQKAEYLAEERSLVLEIDAVAPLNLGTSSEVIALLSSSGAAFEGGDDPGMPLSTEIAGLGDKEFLELANELPAPAREAAYQLLRGVRERFPGDLTRGERNKFVNAPDNFWAIIPQPRARDLLVVVRGEPKRFQPSLLELKRDRAGYTQFKVVTITDVPDALAIITAARRSM